MEKRLRKVRIVLLWLAIGWIGFFTMLSIWLKYRMEDRAKDMLVLRLLDNIDLYRNMQSSGLKQDVLNNLIQQQIQLFRIGRFGTVMHVKNHTIIASADPALNGKPIPDVEFPGGIEEGNFFKMNFDGENYLVAMEKTDDRYVIGLLPYSEIYNDFYYSLAFLAASLIISGMINIFLYRKIRAEVMEEVQRQGC